MSISTFERLASTAEMAVEMDRRGAVIEELEARAVLADRAHKAITAEIEKLQTNLRHWREECGKLHAKVTIADASSVEANRILAAVRKVRDGYADQAKFADVEPAAYFREFVRRLDTAVSGDKPPSPWGGVTT